MSSSGRDDAMDDAGAPDDELAALFAAERARPVTSPAAHVLARVEATIGRGSPPDGGDTPGGDSSPGAPGSAQPAGTSAHPETPTSALAHLARAKLATAVVFALGVTSGAGLYAALRPAASPRVVEREVVREVVREVRVPALAAATVDAGVASRESPVATDAGAQVTLPSRTGVTPSRADATPESRETALLQENALITRAQNALAREQPRSALQALQEHRARFPTGQLTEEREALMVQVLVRLGDATAARGRAQAFRLRYPRSLLLPVVENALRGLP